MRGEGRLWQRSATAPETMVAAAAAKVNWKNQLIQSAAADGPGT